MNIPDEALRRGWADDDPILKALGEARARLSDMEQRALAAEARIEKVRANWSRRYSDTGNLLPDATEAITAALAAAPSGLVEDMRRNTAAQAWDEGRSAWASFEMRCEDASSAGQGAMIGLPVNPYRQETR